MTGPAAAGGQRDAASRPSVESSGAAVASCGGGGDRAGMHRDLRERIEAGAYLIDPGLVAEAMLARMSAVLVAAQAPDCAPLGVQQLQPGAAVDPA